jgi:WXXGXW repeat (2 copies)
MRNYIRTTLLVALLLAGVSTAKAQISVGIRIGAPPPPRVVRVLPRRPGPEFVWVEGYWYPVGRHYSWHEGYWTRPPYEGAVWVLPRYEGGEFFEGYWGGSHGRVEHDHRSDHNRDRDYHGNEHDNNGHGRGHDHK